MKLKPVTLISTKYDKQSPGMKQQSVLLNALRITKDPNKLKQIVGVKTVAEVIRTLDKIALRKEYHKALQSSQIDFNFIVKGIKQECVKGEKSSDRLKGYQILLRSLGMDSYDDSRGENSGNWEDALQNVIKAKQSQKEIEAPVEEEQEYKVVQPKVPDSVKLKKEVESVEAGKSLYE